jgi:hypothetical protein
VLRANGWCLLLLCELPSIAHYIILITLKEVGTAKILPLSSITPLYFMTSFTQSIFCLFDLYSTRHAWLTWSQWIYLRRANLRCSSQINPNGIIELCQYLKKVEAKLALVFYQATESQFLETPLKFWQTTSLCAVFSSRLSLALKRVKFLRSTKLLMLTAPSLQMQPLMKPQIINTPWLGFELKEEYLVCEVEATTKCVCKSDRILNIFE